VTAWSIETATGSAAEFHGRELPSPLVPTVWSFVVARPAVVLGSAQAFDVVDADACAVAGVEVVRRRSGGGAVLLRDGEMVWLDVLIPSTHPHFEPDVARSMWWVGDRCAAALGALGVVGVAVHRGRLVASAWSRLVCFAGLGPGEVTVAGAKVVGISQRRTRDGARFQVMVSLRWRPEVLVGLLAPPCPTAEELAGLGADLAIPADVVRAALVQHLTMS
jgi:lipoate-protein ligase A